MPVGLFSESNQTKTLPKQRSHALPLRLDCGVVMSTVGHRNRQPNNSLSFKRDVFEVLDKMIGELGRRFSGNESLLKACCTIDPSSASFFQWDQMLPTANLFSYLGIDIDKLKGQVSVASNMFH